jgi:hypothetical protein
MSVQKRGHLKSSAHQDELGGLTHGDITSDLSGPLEIG